MTQKKFTKLIKYYLKINIKLIKYVKETIHVY